MDITITMPSRMKIIIAKPSNGMSLGDLLFSVPTKEAEEAAFHKLHTECMGRAKTEFSQREDLIQQVEKELVLIRQTHNVHKLLLLREIARLSEGLGYPAATLGHESGLLMMYLLGITGLHPSLYRFSHVPSELGLTDIQLHEDLSASLAIAAPVRRKLQRRLDQVFSFTKCSHRFFEEIFLPTLDLLEQIGRLAGRTGVTYRNISLTDIDLLQAVGNDLCESARMQLIPIRTCMDAAVLFNYTICMNDEDSPRPDFTDAGKYLLQDNGAALLQQYGFSAAEAFQISRNWSRGEKKESEIKRLEKQGVPREYIKLFGTVENVWNTASCLSRVRWRIMLKYYELNYPRAYQEVMPKLS